MAVSNFSLADYLRRLAAVWPGGKPFLVSSWGWRTQGSGQMHAFDLGDGNGAAGDAFWQRVNNASILTQESDGGTIRNASIAQQPPNEAWYSHQSEFTAGNLRGVRLNGGTVATDGTTSNPVSPTLTTIGINNSESAAAWQTNGALAEVSIWDLTGFDATNRADLSALVGDASGGNAANPTFGIHPPVDPVPAAGGSALLRWWYEYA